MEAITIVVVEPMLSTRLPVAALVRGVRARLEGLRTRSAAPRRDKVRRNGFEERNEVCQIKRAELQKDREEVRLSE